MTTFEHAKEMITTAVARQRHIGAEMLAIERKLEGKLDVRALLVLRCQIEGLLLEHPGHARTWHQLLSAVRGKLRRRGVA